MNPETKANIASAVRHLLAFIAGVAAVKLGLATPIAELLKSQPVNDFVVFIVTAVVPLLWSMRKNSKTEKRVDVALALPAKATREQLKKQIAYLSGK